MIKQYLKSIFVILMIAVLTQSCVLARLNAAPALPTAAEIAPVATQTESAPIVIPTKTIEIPTATATVIAITETSLPKVTISAVKGNIYIRRGPGMAYDPIGVLYKDTSTAVIARDVLARWAQVAIQDSDRMGWIYVKSQFAKVDGDFDSVPDFTTTDWPVPGYLVNCTQHELYIMPGEVHLPPTLIGDPASVVWLYPGFYTVQDITVDGYPKIEDIEMREGVDIKINVDGLGESRKCPKK
jgi:hypothetical protein